MYHCQCLEPQVYHCPCLEPRCITVTVWSHGCIIVNVLDVWDVAQIQPSAEANFIQSSEELSGKQVMQTGHSTHNCSSLSLEYVHVYYDTIA